MTQLHEQATYLRAPKGTDQDELISLNVESSDLHRGWVSPPVTPEQYAGYLERIGMPDQVGFLICRSSDDAIAGVVNLNNIVRGAFQSAYLGYYGSRRYCRQGHMKTGLRLAIGHAFHSMGLHRVEANIQPGNVASIELVKKLGFELEGYSPGYLKINGEWRDHHRFALRTESWQES